MSLQRLPPEHHDDCTNDRLQWNKISLKLKLCRCNFFEFALVVQQKCFCIKIIAKLFVYGEHF